MNKKQCRIILGIMLFFGITIISVILINTKQKKNNWIDNILNSESYKIEKFDCNDNVIKLDNNVLLNVKDMWKNLSNNGPWMGNENKCYEKFVITYDKEGIIRKNEIIIIDDSSIALDLETKLIYYTKAQDLINYLITGTK